MALTIYNAKPYNTLSTAINAMGSNDGTLIVSGQEDITDDLTIPSNISVEIPQGGKLNISSGKEVTFSSEPIAGLYTIFEGAGTVVIGSVSTKIVPQWWGASPSASVATNSTAINASIVALPDYGQWELPGGEYDTSSVITFSTNSNCTIDFIGRIMAQSCSGVSFETISRCDISGVNSYLETGESWGSAHYGIRLKDVDNSKISIKGTYNFGKALYLDGDTDRIAYNDIHLGWLYNSKYGLYIRSVNGGYVNENNYYGGNIRLYADTKAAEADGWGVYFVDAPSHTFNNHRFYGTCIETHHNGMNLQHCTNITLITPRFEDVDANWVDGSGGLEHLVWILGAPDFDESKVSFGDNSRGLLILGAGTNDSNYRNIITDQKYGGISFASRFGFSDTVAHLYSRSIGAAGLRYDDIFGITQTLNKSYEAAAAPGAGGTGDSYAKNAEVRNTNVASGQSVGWTCSVAGTAGTLAGVTGGITNGEKVLTVNDASDLLEGMFITIVGVTGIKNIEKIDGEDVYIYLASDATVAGAAVAYSNPTWVTMPNYP